MKRGCDRRTSMLRSKYLSKYLIDEEYRENLLALISLYIETARSPSTYKFDTNVEIDISLLPMLLRYLSIFRKLQRRNLQVVYYEYDS